MDIRNWSFRSRRTLILLGSGLVVAALAVWLGTPWFGRWMSDRAASANQLDDAIRWLERCAPSDAAIDFLKARRERRAGNLSEAFALVATARRKGFPADRCRRERVLIEAQRGNLHFAEPHLAELLISPGPDAADIYDAFSRGFLKNARVRDAERILATWIKTFPTDHRPLVVQARIDVEQRRLVPAEERLRAALKLSPSGEAEIQLGEVLLAQGRPDEALACFERGLPADGPRARLGQARCLRTLGRPDEARKSLQQLLHDRPNSFEGLLEIGRLELDRGQHAAAVGWLGQALPLQPWNRDAQRLLIVSLRNTGRTREADELQARATAAQKAMHRGSLLLEDLQKRPQDPEVRYELGMICLEHDDPREAMLWLQSALQLAPGHSQARQALEQAVAKAKAFESSLGAAPP